ncbi:transmembrane and TPR repeat-containing protein 4 [Balamuthia mandrillaris]
MGKKKKSVAVELKKETGEPGQEATKLASSSAASAEDCTPKRTGELEKSVKGAPVKKDDTTEEARSIFGFIFDEPRGALAVPLAVIVALLGFVIFVNNLNGELVFDDRAAIRDNMDLRPETPWQDLWGHDFWGNPINTPGVWTNKSYRPITVLSFRLNYWLHGLETFGYHLVNVVGHAFACYLFYYVSLIVLHGCKLSAFVSAALFAVHPIHTDGIDSIVGRAEALYTVFYFLCFLSYFKAATPKGSSLDSPSPKGTTEFGARTMLWFVPWTVCFFLSCFSKEIGVTVAGVCIGWDLLYNLDAWQSVVLPLRFRFLLASFLSAILPSTMLSSPWLSAIFRTKKQTKQVKQDQEQELILWKQFWRRFLLSFSVVLVYLIHRSIFVGGLAGLEMQKHHNPIAFEAGLTRWLSTFHLHFRYVWVLLFPYYLSADYSYDCIPLLRSLNPSEEPRVLLIPLLWFSIAGFLVGALCSKRWHKALILSFAWFLLPFLPASQLFFSPGTVLAERVLYLPSTGHCLLLSWLLSRILPEDDFSSVSSSSSSFPSSPTSSSYRKKNKKQSSPSNQSNHTFNFRRTLYLTLVLLLLCLMGLRTWLRNPDWGTQDALFRTAVEVCPRSGKALFNYGASLETAGREQQAQSYYERAVAVDAGYDLALGRLGKIWTKRGDYAKALTYLKAILDKKPQVWHASAYHDAGVAYWKSNKTQIAERVLTFAAGLPRQEPQYAGVSEYNLACLYIEQGKIGQAFGWLEKATKQNPNAHWAWNAMAMTLSLANKPTPAKRMLAEKAIELVKKELQGKPGKKSLADALQNYESNLAEVIRREQDPKAVPKFRFFAHIVA